jgi:hypothetical protein
MSTNTILLVDNLRLLPHPLLCLLIIETPGCLSKPTCRENFLMNFITMPADWRPDMPFDIYIRGGQTQHYFSTTT